MFSGSYCLVCAEQWALNQYGSLSYTDPQVSQCWGRRGLFSISLTCLLQNSTREEPGLVSTPISSHSKRIIQSSSSTTQMGTQVWKAQKRVRVRPCSPCTQGGAGCSGAVVPIETVPFYLQSRVVEAEGKAPRHHPHPISYSGTMLTLNLLPLHCMSSSLNRISILHAL